MLGTYSLLLIAITSVQSSAYLTCSSEMNDICNVYCEESNETEFCSLEFEDAYKLDNSIVGYITTLNTIHIIMNITFHSLSNVYGEWQDIINIGNNFKERYPSIGINPFDGRFSFSFTNTDSWADNQEGSTYPVVKTNTLYNIEYTVTQNTLTIGINGEILFYDDNYPSHQILSDRKMFFGGNWNKEADATMHYFMIEASTTAPSLVTTSSQYAPRSPINPMNWIIPVVIVCVGVCLLFCVIGLCKYSEYCDRWNKQIRAKSNVLQMTELITHNDSDLESVKLWLTTTVGYGQYYQLFIANGYDKLSTIKEIESKQEIIAIGIELAGHQTRIWAEILKLKETEFEGNEGESNYISS